MQDLMPYEDFKATETIKYGTAATSASANHAPLFIKEELNRLYNFTKIRFSELPLAWDARQTYQIGDVVSYLGKIYEATAVNGNQTPPNSAWKLFDTNSINMNLKYVQINSDTYINLVARNNYKMMRANQDGTNAIMSPRNGLVPWDNGSSSSLGTSNQRFKNVFSVTGNFSNVSTGTIEATSGTIGTLNSTTINATSLNGTASRAKYADIAEKYSTDFTYEPGTVLGFGGSKELTIYNEGMKLCGVVSTKPGYMLNSEANGQYIALKGRVPCKIIGTASKGQYIIASNNGIGVAVDDYTFEQSKLLLGIAINDSKDSVVEIKV